MHQSGLRAPLPRWCDFVACQPHLQAVSSEIREQRQSQRDLLQTGTAMTRSLRLRSVLGAALLASVVSCSGREPTPPVSPSADGPAFPEGVSAAISDASRPNGTAGFNWLPPLSPRRRSYPAAFDATLSPTVEVCEWVADACARVVATMTTAGTTDGKVTVNRLLQAYETVWRTRRGGVDSKTTYRVRVSVDGQVVGYADIDVLKSAWGLLGADFKNFFPLLAGLDLPIRFRLSVGVAGPPDPPQPNVDSSSAIIGAAGGTVSTPSGDGTIQIPAGALETNVVISVKVDRDTVAGSPGFGATRIVALPAGTRFAAPVTVSLRVPNTVVGSPTLFLRTDDRFEWFNTVVDSASGTLRVQTTHFSTWYYVFSALAPDTYTIGFSVSSPLPDSITPADARKDLVAAIAAWQPVMNEYGVQLRLALPAEDPDITISFRAMETLPNGREVLGRFYLLSPISDPRKRFIAINSRFRFQTLNDRRQQFAPPYPLLLAPLLAHELGHSLGIMHVEGSGTPVMAQGGPGDAPYALSPEDVIAASTAYLTRQQQLTYRSAARFAPASSTQIALDPSQSAVTPLPTVRVVDASGAPVAGVTVLFSNPNQARDESEGTVTGGVALTAANGEARLESWTLPASVSEAGYILVASAWVNGAEQSVEFVATLDPPVVQPPAANSPFGSDRILLANLTARKIFSGGSLFVEFTAGNVSRVSTTFANFPPQLLRTSFDGQVASGFVPCFRTVGSASLVLLGTFILETLDPLPPYAVLSSRTIVNSRYGLILRPTAYDGDGCPTSGKFVDNTVRRFTPLPDPTVPSVGLESATVSWSLAPLP